jgi:serine protease Do
MSIVKRLLSGTTIALVCIGYTQCFASPNACDVGVDNQEQLNVMTAKLQALYEAGKATKMETLIGQLTRNNCDVRLETPSKTSVSPSQLYEQRKKGVVIVGGLYKCKKCEKWHAAVSSGFLITSSGIMITNYHVVDETNNVTLAAMTYDGKVYPVKEVLAAHENDDIAVLRLDGSGFPYLRLSAGSPIGSSIWVIGHPGKRFYSFTGGIISGYSIQAWKEKKTTRMSITADFGVGSSGGPVLDESGNVVGMVATTQAVHAKEHGEDDYTQMVFKECVPAKSIVALISGKTRPGGN